MAGFTAQGATFSFRGTKATVVGVSVEMPAAEVTDMTDALAPAGATVIVPTGDWKGGTISVDYIHDGSPGLTAEIRKVGALEFASPQFSFTYNAILMSATGEIRVGELVRGNLKFQVTDYSDPS